MKFAAFFSYFGFGHFLASVRNGRTEAFLVEVHTFWMEKSIFARNSARFYFLVENSIHFSENAVSFIENFVIPGGNSKL